MRRWFEFNRRRKPISPVLLECMHKQIELYGKAQPKEDPGDHPGNGSWKIQQLDRSRAKGEPTESSAIVQVIQGYWRDSSLAEAWAEKTGVNGKRREYNT